MITFSHKNVLKFIELISEQRDLYDPNSPNYKSKNKRTKIWEDIATKFDKKRLTGNTCKNLWNKLKISYVRFKKTGSVVTKRTFAKSKVFELMTFLEVTKQQCNEKQPQGNKNQHHSNENQQQGNEKSQHSKENQQQWNEKNAGPKNKNAVKNRQSNKINLVRKTTDGLFEVKKQQGIQNKLANKSAASQSGNAQQYAMPFVQLNISGVETNLGSKSNEETPPQTFDDNIPAAKPNTQFWPQQRQKKRRSDKSLGDELHLFSTQVRTILGKLPCELQIKAQEEVFQVLSKYKKLALLSMSVSESSTNITD